MQNQIAQTILAQLGGNRFCAMTGARNLVAGPDFLQLSIGRGAKNKANKLRVTLDANDTYTVEFFNLVKFEVKTKGKVSGVYADQLRAVFTAETGMETSL